MSKDFKLYTGYRGLQLMDAYLKQEYEPTDENKAVIDGLLSEIHKEGIEDHEKRKRIFIEKWGEDKFNLIDKHLINKDNWLAFSDKKYFSWEIKHTVTEEYYEYEYIEFNRGIFSCYTTDEYAYEKNYLEKDISAERVLEILNKK